MANAEKPDFIFRRNGRVHLNRLGASVQLTAGSRGVRIGGSDAGYTMFRGSVKGTGYTLHLPVSLSLPPPVRQRMPSHFDWSLPPACPSNYTQSCCAKNPARITWESVNKAQRRWELSVLGICRFRKLKKKDWRLLKRNSGWILKIFNAETEG